MIKIVIIEDERLIAAELRRMIQKVSPDVEISAMLSSVKEGIEYFASNPHPDLIFSDVNLGDGLSFEIFNEVSLKTPIVFITAYDDFILNAFEYNGIEYLLKPVDERDLEKAINRYRTLETHFSRFQNFTRAFTQKIRKRLIVRKGMENIALRTEDIVMVYTENKVVYVIDKEGKKYLSDKKLLELEEEMDTSTFFRANRQYIVNVDFIRGYKAYEKVKLQLDLSIPLNNHCVIISQETAPHFRQWISEA
jgi:DNA-binding LytR/AlgR family response regulator